MFTSFKKIFVTVAWFSFIFPMLTYPVYAADWPHRTTGNAWWCTQCHVVHNTTNGQFTTQKGNPNVCQSCHTSGGPATDKPMLNVHLAVPGTQGVSHRWDSGPGGYITPNTSNGSTGTVYSGVNFTWNTLFNEATNLENLRLTVFQGSVPRTFTISITSDGDVGGAGFSCTYQDEGSSTQPSCGSGTVQSTYVPSDGYSFLKIAFVNGSTSPSFKTGDSWSIKIRPQINYPSTHTELATRMFREEAAPQDLNDVDVSTAYVLPGSTYGKAACSTCHNQHNQSKNPFDPFSPTAYTSGATEDRHFQRVNNEQNQMCLDCHSHRNIGNDFSDADATNDVRTYSGTKKSHPVGVTFPSTKTEHVGLMHTFPKEPSTSLFNPSADVSDKAAIGKANTGSTNNCVTGDIRPAVNTNDLVNLYIYFISGTNQGTGKLITSNTATEICWTGNLTIVSGDKFVVDMDGNPSNNFRFYNSGTISFTGGQVYCMTCHGLHWVDSNETTYDAP